MPTTASPETVHVLTGSYTPDTGGEGTGLAALRLDPSTGFVSYDEEVPSLPVTGASFLAAHSTLDVVYSTNETDPGTVSAVARRRSAGVLTPLGAPVDSGGANPCHLTVHPDGGWLLTANYGSSDPAASASVRLDAGGRPVELTTSPSTKGRARSPDGRRAATPIRCSSTLRVPKTSSMTGELQVLANGRRSADRRDRLIDRAAATALPRRVERVLSHTVAANERR